MLSVAQKDLKAEDVAIASIHRSFMKDDNKSLYIACEDIEFKWNLHQVREFDKLWKRGVKNGVSPIRLIIELAEYFDRPQEEIAILAIDRGMKGRIGR